MPQKCHVRSHKSRAEITHSSCCSRLFSTPASTEKSLLTFMYKYIQFIDDSRAGMVVVVVGRGGGCQSSGCGVVQLVEKTSAEKCGWLDVTSPGVAHAHGESGAPVEHKHGRMEIYLQECALLWFECSGVGGGGGGGGVYADILTSCKSPATKAPTLCFGSNRGSV